MHVYIIPSIYCYTGSEVLFGRLAYQCGLLDSRCSAVAKRHSSPLQYLQLEGQFLINAKFYYKLYLWGIILKIISITSVGEWIHHVYCTCLNHVLTVNSFCNISSCSLVLQGIHLNQLIIFFSRLLKWRRASAWPTSTFLPVRTYTTLATVSTVSLPTQISGSTRTMSSWAAKGLWRALLELHHHQMHLPKSPPIHLHPLLVPPAQAPMEQARLHTHLRDWHPI